MLFIGRENMKNKKVIGIIVTIVLIAIITIIILNTINKAKKEEQAKQILVDFISYINNKEYEKMYEKVEKIEITKEDFIKRNKNIYEGIDAEKIELNITNIEKQDKVYKIDYHEKMLTSAGEIEFNNTVEITKENKLKWSSRFIFPQLEDNEKIRISSIKSKRGDILDRNNNKLATDGKVWSAGIVPGKLGESKEENIKKISKLTGVSEEYINKQLSASWVKDDTFVPIKKISKTNTELKEQLLTIPGVLINEEDGRVYQLGKEAGHLIGYVQAISAEELEEKSGNGYTTTSVIGKLGLERTYESTLRGIDGVEIYIINENGDRIKEIKKQEKQDGKDIKLTIDSTLQKQLYEQMKNDKGFFVVMNPETGEILSTISTPTFDSNDFVVGITTDNWDKLNNDENKPLYNRFVQKYCPGSTFKPVTGAIGLTLGTIKTNDDLGYSGTSWQKDSSWGSYKITTLTGYNGPKNLLNGMLHSDNIYFAQTSLKIGAETFSKSLNKIGFNETLDFPLLLARSQYSANNGGAIEGETRLADSGYGQGSILVNPIHMASIYSAFYNNGNMIRPYIEYKEDKNPEILKQEAFSNEAANSIKNTLIQVVENKEGTANDMKITGITIAGKTGTAELKTSSNDKESGTLGWFNCFTIDKTGGDILIISMVENTQNNSEGGSHYLINKIRTLF